MDEGRGRHYCHAKDVARTLFVNQIGLKLLLAQDWPQRINLALS